jgi:hypothetical protein
VTPPGELPGPAGPLQHLLRPLRMQSPTLRGEADLLVPFRTHQPIPSPQHLHVKVVVLYAKKLLNYLYLSTRVDSVDRRLTSLKNIIIKLANPRVVTQRLLGYHRGHVLGGPQPCSLPITGRQVNQVCDSEGRTVLYDDMI